MKAVFSNVLSSETETRMVGGHEGPGGGLGPGVSVLRVELQSGKTK